MYILYNLISYATGACLGSHSIGTAHSLKYPSSSTTPMHNTNPEGFDSFRVLLCPSGRHLRGGPRSGVWPSFVPLFGYRMLSVPVSVPEVLSRSAVLSAVGMLCGAVLCSCSSCRHRLRIASALRSLYHQGPGSSAVFRVSCPTPDIVRSDYATTVRQTTRRARGLQRSCGQSAVGCRHRSCSHALPTLRKRYANALPRSAGCGLRYP